MSHRYGRGAAMHRVVYHVIYRSTYVMPWTVTKEGTVAVWASRLTKADAVTEGRAHCRLLWASGHPAQLKIHGKDGTIQSEATYGHDPLRYKG